MIDWSRYLFPERGGASVTDLAENQDKSFLPNFCRGEMVVNVVLLAEFLAVIATIITPDITKNIFQDLLLISIFIQWIALASISVLCIARNALNCLPPKRASLMAYLILLCVTWLVSELVLWVLWNVGMINTPRPVWYIYFHGQNLLISAIINALALRYFLARHQLRQRTLSEAKARMEILKYRIRPHFLYNSMNIIASLTQRAPARAESAIEDLADLFRLMLDESKDLVPTHSEIAVAKKYLNLEKLRLGKRLTVEWDVSGSPRTTKTPVLMLQLLLENAIHYGIEPLPEGGKIQVDVNAQSEKLLIRVRSPSLQEESGSINTAFDNIQLRLHEYFGEQGTLRISDDDTGRTVVEIVHPAYGVVS